MRVIACLMGFLIVVAAGCSRRDDVKRIMESPITYQSHVSPWADFDSYKTWDFVPAPRTKPEMTRTEDPAVDAVIKEGIAKQLNLRGYKQTTSVPDFVVNYHVVVETIDKDYIKKMYDGKYYPEYRMDFSGPRSARNRWEEGSLIVFVFETVSRKIVWRGTALAEVADDAPIEMRETRINEALKWMFTSLPGKPRWEDKIIR